MKLSRDGIAVQEGNIKKQSLPQKFKFGPWLVAVTENESYFMTHILDDMQIKVSVNEEHLNLELNGTSKWLNGLFEELMALDVALIEKQTKVVSSTTLLINENYVPATTMKLKEFASKCWKVDADKTDFLY
jgi:hypothetical protein